MQRVSRLALFLLLLFCCLLALLLLLLPRLLLLLLLLPPLSPLLPLGRLLGALLLLALARQLAHVELLHHLHMRSGGLSKA